jgi:hypothetical protein
VDTGIGFAVDYMTPIAKAGKPLLKTTTSSAFVFEQVDDTGKVVGTGSKYVCEQEVEHIKPKVWRKLADEWSYEMIPLSDYAISTPGGGTFAWVESASKRTVKTTSETLENGMRKGGKELLKSGIKEASNKVLGEALTSDNDDDRKSGDIETIAGGVEDLAELL